MRVDESVPPKLPSLEDGVEFVKNGNLLLFGEGEAEDRGEALVEIEGDFGPFSFFYADVKVSRFRSDFRQLKDLVADLVSNGEGDFGFGIGVFPCALVVVFEGADEFADDFFDVVEEEPGGWEA